MWKQCFSGDLKKKELLGSGPFSRDGRVTGNKHIFVLGLSVFVREQSGAGIHWAINTASPTFAQWPNDIIISCTCNWKRRAEADTTTTGRWYTAQSNINEHIATTLHSDSDRESRSKLCIIILFNWFLNCMIFLQDWIMLTPSAVFGAIALVVLVCVQDATSQRALTTGTFTVYK